MARLVYLVDLANEAIAGEYERVHQPGRVPCAVLDDIRTLGIAAMEIYRFADRLVMVTDSNGDAGLGDRVSSEVSREWEARMGRFQRPLSGAEPGIKWQKAAKIFDLHDHQTQG